MAIERRELEPGDPLDDRRLSTLLRSLPRERARAGFGARVVARLDERPRRRAGWLAISAVTASLAILVGTVLGFRSFAEQRRVNEVRRALAEIRNEHRALAAEIERLPTTDPEPNRVYLGGDDQADYFVDLTRVDEPKPANPVPAALRERS
jgi:hypothetical protein